MSMASAGDLSAIVRRHRQERLQRSRALCDSLMSSIDAYVERYDVRGDSRLAQAASDVCDGWLTRGELAPLIAGRKIALVGKPESEHSVCGDIGRYWTIELTAAERKRRYPNRMEDAPAKQGRSRGRR